MGQPTTIKLQHQEFMACHAEIMEALEKRDYLAMRLAIERQRVIIQLHKHRLEKLIYAS